MSRTANLTGPLAAARALTGTVRARADEIEAARRLPTDLATAMADAGLFRLCVPRSLGGIEAEVDVLLRVIEELSKADGSAGWCLMIGATTGLLAGLLPEDAATEIYGRDPAVITGGVFAPKGAARVVALGYQVTGRWPYDGIVTTRAIRRYTDEAVTDDEAMACIRAAVQAPSGGNIQPWQFLVVTDARIKAKLGDLYRRAYTRYEAALLPLVPARRSHDDEVSWERTLAASRHLAEHLAEAPLIVLALMPAISMTLTDDDGELDVGTPFASVYPAVQNLMLAARSRGIGSVLTTVLRIYQDEARRGTRLASPTATRSSRSSRWAGLRGDSVSRGVGHRSP